VEHSRVRYAVRPAGNRGDGIPVPRMSQLPDESNSCRSGDARVADRRISAGSSSKPLQAPPLHTSLTHRHAKFETLNTE
jgi:hypothetical protein